MLIVAGLVSVSLTGCVEAFGGGQCDINIQNPHQSHGTPTAMDAKATIRCTVVVTAVSVTIKMQRKSSSGVWADVPGTINTRETASLAANSNFVVTTRPRGCVAGTYRAAGRGNATYKGVANASAVWQYGNAAKVVCKS